MKINIRTNSDTVELNGTEVFARANNHLYRYPLSDVEEILILTTDNGPAVDDMFLILRILGGIDLYVSSSHPMYSRFLFDELGKTLNLDYQKIIDASHCIENSVFSVYRKQPVSNELVVYVDRDSVCEEDSLYDHGKNFHLPPETTCEDLCEELIRNKYFPTVTGCNPIWELISVNGERIFTWYVQKKKCFPCVPGKKLCDFGNDGVYRFRARFFASPFLYEERLLNITSESKTGSSPDEVNSQVQYCRQLLQEDNAQIFREQKNEPVNDEKESDDISESPENVKSGICAALLISFLLAFILSVFGNNWVFGAVICFPMNFISALLYQKYAGGITKKRIPLLALFCALLIILAMVANFFIFKTLSVTGLLARIAGYMAALAAGTILTKKDVEEKKAPTPQNAKNIKQTIEKYKEVTRRSWSQEMPRLYGLLNGTEKPGILVEEMQEYFETTFSCTLYDCFSSDFTNHRSVCFVFATGSDLNKLQAENGRGFDKQKLTQIREKYSEICRKYGMERDFQNPNWYEAIPVSAEKELKYVVIGQSFDDLEKTIAEFPEIQNHQYYYDRILVFYRSPEETRKNAVNGTSERIKGNLLTVLKDHDIFGIIRDIDVVFLPVEEEPAHRPIGFAVDEQT